MNTSKKCVLLGIPVQAGAGRNGCDMGPSAYRAAGLSSTLQALGYDVEDCGNITPSGTTQIDHHNKSICNLAEISQWTLTIAEQAYKAAQRGVPIFLGGDHSLSAGSLTGVSRKAKEEGRPLFVLWLDAHPDFHSLETTKSGNLHGVPLAYAAGLKGFSPFFPDLIYPIELANTCMMGIRSIDPEERLFLSNSAVTLHDMRSIDEYGVSSLLGDFLNRVAKAQGALHVSFDVDFLDPDIAPGVGTTVPGGATFREAHLIMEMLHDSGLVTSLDLAELNPFLDERGRTALLMADLVGSLMGRRIFDRPTQGYRQISGAF